jgi:predicted porin
MKKIIATMLTAGAACPVFAQGAQATAFIISGNINAQYEFIAAPGATNALSPADHARVAGRSRANQNASELRFTAQRDVDNSLQGFVTIGSEIQSFSGANANNTSTFAVRNTGVGLRGAFGEVAIGRWDSHYQWGSFLIDKAFITAGMAGDSKSIISYVNGTVFVGNRFANTIRFNTVKMHGLTGHVIYARNEGTVTALQGIGELADNSVNLALTYEAGPFVAFGSYFDRRDANLLIPFFATGIASAMSQKSARVGVSYTLAFGLTLAAIIDQTKQTHRAATTTVSMKRTAWVVPLRYVQGKHLVSASYGAAGDSSGDLMPASIVATNQATGAKFTHFGYQYAFDKATNLQLGWARISNRANGTYDLSLNGGIGIAGVAATRGADPRSFEVGMRYAF